MQHAFASDENGDNQLSRAEFRSWAKLNSNVGQWVASLSSFVLNHLGPHIDLAGAPVYGR